MTRDEQIEAVRAVLRGEQFAVFAFAGAPGAAPYSAVMFCAETLDLELIFATSPGALKGQYLSSGNGACALLDTRGVGLANMAEFARVAVQGQIERVTDPDRLADLHEVYREKIPPAGAFLDREGVQTFRLIPSLIVYSRGFGERFEISFPAT